MNLSNRKLKKQRYASFQKLYKKNRKAAYDSLQNNNSISDSLKSSTVFSFWQHLLTHKSVVDPHEEALSSFDGGFSPDLLVYPKEVTEVRATKKSSPGFDGLTVFETEAINIKVRAKLFSIFLLLSWVPDSILNSYTIFIPKKVDTSKPPQLRPISIASNLLRQFHKILVKRITPAATLSDFQFGFRPLDGVAKGIDLFDAILRSVQEKYSPIAMAVLDLEKAFDSVSHNSIYGCLERLNLHHGYIKYLKFVYSQSKTQLSFRKQESGFFHPVKGVRQGDPLSPLLFLIVFNTAIDMLPTDIGFRFRSLLINHIAYADDLVVMAESAAELQHLLNILQFAFSKVGLKINLMKSFTIVWLKIRKRKR